MNIKHMKDLSSFREIDAVLYLQIEKECSINSSFFFSSFFLNYQMIALNKYCFKLYHLKAVIEEKH